MAEGDVVLTYLLQADGRRKRRPAIVLCEMPKYRDLLLCGISTRLSQEVSDFDELISPSDTDFAMSGLDTESLIRLAFIGVYPQSSIIGPIGNISTERRKRLLERLAAYLTGKASK